jgi:hypothetical protein
MSPYPEILIGLVIRVITAFGVGCLGVWLLASSSGLFMMFLGFACIMLTPVIVAPAIARLIAEPASSIYYPREETDYIPPVYGIPESKRAKGLYEEAMAGFEKIIENYPDEVRPYIEMIDIAIRNLKDPERANQIYQRGMANLKKDEAKQVLVQMYSAIRTRLNAKPSN